LKISGCETFGCQTGGCIEGDYIRGINKKKTILMTSQIAQYLECKHCGFQMCYHRNYIIR